MTPRRDGRGREEREVLEVLSVGAGVSFQDLGRRGWKRYGVPSSGAMDRHAAAMANRLMGNAPEAPVLEVLLHGARFRVLRTVAVGVTGAVVGGTLAQEWRVRELAHGDVLEFPVVRGGLWSYVAVRGGWEAERWFGSVSVYPRGGLGEAVRPGDRLCAGGSPEPEVRPRMGRRWLSLSETRDYRHPPAIPVWPGPQWALFSEGERRRLFDPGWRVSARSDRTGYRLEGPTLDAPSVSLASEPVIPGTLQVPPGGQLIVTQRDGPTVGGYPKLGLVDPPYLSWVAQHRPGQEIRFVPAQSEGAP